MMQIVEGGCVDPSGGTHLRAKLTRQGVELLAACSSFGVRRGLAPARAATGAAQGPPSWLNDPRRSPSQRRRPHTAFSRWSFRSGDRLADGTREWKIIGRPYTTAGGKTTNVRVRLIEQSMVTEIRNVGTSGST